MARKPKVSKTKPKDKVESAAPKNVLAAFYSKGLKKIEKETKIYGSSINYADRLSSGVLCYDWICGGGLLPGFTSMSGEEQSGKTTLVYHSEASAILQGMPFTAFWDAEGTVSPKYASSIWKPFGLDLKWMIDHPEEGFHYYRENVIEKMFTFFVKQLNAMPSKVWQPDASSWSYVVPKRDPYFKEMMEAMGWKADRALSNDNEFICLTDNSKPEGLIAVDSFASMLTENDEEEEERSKVRAAEATAFSLNLKRVMTKLQNKQFIMLGTNQLRKIPGHVYGGPDDQLYEPGGDALKFYSQCRSRNYSRSVREGFERDKENGKLCIESSVEGAGKDRYAFKEIKNTKNKTGVPALKTYVRAWVSDRDGRGRGYDPVFDVYQYLVHTKQIQEKGSKLRFSLKDSIGRRAAGALNECAHFEWDTLKRLVIAETTGRKDLLRIAAKELKIDFAPKLREKLFHQLRTDPSIYQVHEALKEKKEVDVEEL